MDYFAQHVRKYAVAGSTLENTDWKSYAVFDV